MELDKNYSIKFQEDYSYELIYFLDNWLTKCNPRKNNSWNDNELIQ